MMALQDDNDFQLAVDRFEDDVLALAYYIKERDVICCEYNLLRAFNTKVKVHVHSVQTWHRSAMINYHM